MNKCNFFRGTCFLFYTKFTLKTNKGLWQRRGQNPLNQHQQTYKVYFGVLHTYRTLEQVSYLWRQQSRPLRLLLAGNPG
jgi:hypothetical protein